MKIQKNSIVIFIIGLLLLTNSRAFSENVFFFSNPVLCSNNSFTVDVNIANTDTLAGFQIPISYKHSDDIFSVDTVLFDESRCETFELKHIEIFENQRTVFIMVINNIDLQSDINFLLPDSGLICRVVFSIPDSMQVDSIDSLSSYKFKLKKGKKLKDKIQNQIRDFRVEIWKPDATAIRCRVENFELH